MTTRIINEGAYLSKIQEEYARFFQSSGFNGATLYDLLELLSLGRFRAFLEDAGLSELLKQPGNITIIAPVDEAFDSIDSSILSELQGDKRNERIRTLARTHIITAPSLIRNFMLRELPVEANYDMNGDKLDLDMTVVSSHEGGYSFVDGYAPAQGGLCVINSINGVKPIDPLFQGQGNFRASNGTIVLISQLLVGKEFLRQKYVPRWLEISGTRDGTKPSSLWERLIEFGFTEFCALAERVGLKDFLNAPREKGDRINVFAPINEAFQRIDMSRFSKTVRAERFIKRHIFDDLFTQNLLGERDHIWDKNSNSYQLHYPYSLGAGRLKGSNGYIMPVVKCAFPSVGSSSLKAWAERFFES